MSKPHLVVLTGAGISAESGLKTFRDSDGLWEGYSVYEVASPDGWEKNPHLVLDFYNARRLDILQAKPNAAHTGLAKLEKDYQVTIITQNIDDLHERAGSTNVIHLHGEIINMRSCKNEALIYPYKKDIHWGDTAEDGGQLRPQVVWFGEPILKIGEAESVVEKADIFVIIGTSLVVYPAAGLAYLLKPGVPVYVIDKRIPEETEGLQFTPIETNATEGVRRLTNLLKQKGEHKKK
ncbi:MAG: SIR2 family NAD-dependent protein deacylase [Chitinophagaceae bacterium]